MPTLEKLTKDLDFGLGVYSLADARSLVGQRRGASERQLRYWVRTGLTPVARGGRPTVLTFDDVVSLELVARFRQREVTLQRVRKFEAELKRLFPEVERPLAHRLFFTDGLRVWAEYGDAESRQAIELVGDKPGHFVWTDAIATFADEIRYDKGGAAVGWDLSDWVEINPAVQFGLPVVRGTRTPVRTIGANLRVATPEQVADWYGLTVEQVVNVKEWLANAG